MQVSDGLAEFQFLIGTLKTVEADRIRRYPSYVSIPHRYATNTLCRICSRSGHIGFQFLIGTLKTCSCGILPLRHVQVSIPHRYAKNVSGCTIA